MENTAVQKNRIAKMVMAVISLTVVILYSIYVNPHSNLAVVFPFILFFCCFSVSFWNGIWIVSVTWLDIIGRILNRVST